MSQKERTRRLGPDDRGMMDVPFLSLVLILTGIGLLMMFSASYVRATHEGNGPMYYFLRQAAIAGVGVGAMLFISRFSCHIYKKFNWYIYWATVILLLGVLVIGVEVNGARRWIRIAGQQFQPSEVAKFAAICMIATLTDLYGDKMADWHYGIRNIGAVLMVLLLLIVLERHLSALMIMGALIVVMLYVGGVKKRWLMLGVGLAVGFAGIYIATMGYANDRILAWLHPEEYALNKGYQVIQSQYAIGSGGLFGLGFGMSRQKYLYLPFEYNDYIFAIVCEELGFIGAVGIMVLFALLVIRGYWIAMNAADRFSSMMAVGITTLLALQVVLNIGVVCNLLPSTGVGLPFFSYGGTNLLMTFGEMGIMLSISRWSSSRRK